MKTLTVSKYDARPARVSTEYAEPANASTIPSAMGRIQVEDAAPEPLPGRAEEDGAAHAHRRDRERERDPVEEPEERGIFEAGVDADGEQHRVHGEGRADAHPQEEIAAAIAVLLRRRARGHTRSARPARRRRAGKAAGAR